MKKYTQDGHVLVPKNNLKEKVGEFTPQATKKHCSDKP